MKYLFIFLCVYLIILSIGILNILYKILYELQTARRDNKPKENKYHIRKHSSIENSNYNNSFGGRKAYEIYKNKSGLYEPVTPSKGIQIKKKEA